MESHNPAPCEQVRKAIKDTLEVISGKWKLLILYSLYTRPLRFGELVREIDITPRMLSKELQDLEMNKLIHRKVYESKPVTVEYSITEYGRSLNVVFEEMAKWGMNHRKVIMTE